LRTDDHDHGQLQQRAEQQRFGLVDGGLRAISSPGANE